MKGKYSRFYAILSQANAAGLAITKDEAVAEHTGGKTTSLSALSPGELAGLEQSLSSATSASKLGIPAGPPPGGKTCETMRKAIIAIFKSIGRDTAAAKAWAEKYGVFGNKKAFNDYDAQELWQLIRNAEKMKSDHIRSVNQRL